MKQLLLFFVLCAFFSCTPAKEKLSKVWFFIATEKASEKSKGKGNLPADLNSLSFLNLHEDGNYTAYLDKFEYGRWMVADDQLVLENENKQERLLPINKVTKDEFVFTVGNDTYEFEGFENKFATQLEDPFSKENNEWRIKAKHKESDDEITARLKNHFHFWEQYFNWALKTDKEILNVRSLPSPLKIYSNGFEVIPLYDQSPKWTDNFFDFEDSKIAYDKVNNLLVKEDIDWPNTKNRFKLFVSAFHQLQEMIR
jgi:hypothetical protein